MKVLGNNQHKIIFGDALEALKTQVLDNFL